MNKNDGMNYAPVGKPQPVVREGEFVFAAAALDHGHIYGMSNGLIEAGATLKWVYDPDPAKVDKFIQQYPQAGVADSLDVILADDEVRLVAGAAIPAERCALGLKAMAAGKDYFTDKAPLPPLNNWQMPKPWWKKRAGNTPCITANACMLRARSLPDNWCSKGPLAASYKRWGRARTGKGPAALTGSTIGAISAAFYAISAAIRLSSSCFTPATVTPPWWQAGTER